MNESSLDQSNKKKERRKRGKFFIEINISQFYFIFYKGERKQDNLSTSMEIYSNTEKVSSDKKIFKNNLLKETLSKDEDSKQGSTFSKQFQSPSPQKNLKKENVIQNDYEEIKIVKENEPNTKETFISVKSKVVFGDNKERKSKVGFGDTKEKKKENNMIEKKNLESLNDSGKKVSDDDIINEEFKKLSEKKNKVDLKNNGNSTAEKTKKNEFKNEAEIMRNSNEIPKKEKMDAEFVNQKKIKTTEKESESAQLIKIRDQTKTSTFEVEEKKALEKPQISGKKVKKVVVAEEPIKVYYLSFIHFINKLKK